MSRLEKAVVSIVEVFEEYAGKDDEKHQLSSGELQELLQKEISNPEFQVSTFACLHLCMSAVALLHVCVAGVNW